MNLKSLLVSNGSTIYTSSAVSITMDKYMIQMQLIVFIASYTLTVFTALTGSTYYIWTPIKLLFRNASSSFSVTPFCMLIHVLPLSPVMDHSTLLSVGDGTFSVMESLLLNGLNCLTFVGQVSLLSFAGVEVLALPSVQSP